MTGTLNQHLWTPEEDARLIALLRDRPELNYEQLGEEMGMTKNQVIGRRARLKLHKAPCRFNGHKWSPERDAMMRALLGEGHSRAEIGRRMEMTKNAIIGRCHRTGLCEERYTGPTAMERMRALHDRLDAVLAESAAIPRLPVPKKSNTGRAGARQSDDFGLPALGHGQNGFRALAASSGKLR